MSVFLWKEQCMKDIQLNELKDYIKKQPEDFFVTADLTALTDKMDGIDKKEGVKDEYRFS
jgi:hypothetical protein